MCTVFSLSSFFFCLLCLVSGILHHSLRCRSLSSSGIRLIFGGLFHSPVMRPCISCFLLGNTLYSRVVSVIFLFLAAGFFSSRLFFVILTDIVNHKIFPWRVGDSMLEVFR